MTVRATIADDAMTPGDYLQKRRAPAGLSRLDVARALAATFPSVTPEIPTNLSKVEGRLAEGEDNKAHFGWLHLAVLQSFFRFDAAVYLKLVDRFSAGPGTGLPEPMVCRACACSWMDACEIPAAASDQIHHGLANAPATTCAWSHRDPGLCTACDTRLGNHVTYLDGRPGPPELSSERPRQ